MVKPEKGFFEIDSPAKVEPIASIAYFVTHVSCYSDALLMMLQNYQHVWMGFYFFSS